MDLSVVIRCCDDKRVFQCIDSVDEDVEIVVSLCKNDGIQRKLEKMNIHYCIVPRGNLSITSNVGFEAATHHKVIITDSDTVFKKGCIKQMYSAFEKFKVVRPRILFLYDSKISFSKVVAEARDYVYSLPVVYTPGIGVRKDLIPDVGDFLFNNPVPFAVDADLNFRLREAKIPVKYLKNAHISHIAVSIKHDLKAAFRIGSGCVISAAILSKQKNFPFNATKIRKKLKAVKSIDYPKIVRKKGVKIFIYQLIWDFFFYSGEIYQLLKC